MSGGDVGLGQGNARGGPSRSSRRLRGQSAPDGSATVRTELTPMETALVESLRLVPMDSPVQSGDGVRPDTFTAVVCGTVKHPILKQHDDPRRCLCLRCGKRNWVNQLNRHNGEFGHGVCDLLLCGAVTERIRNANFSETDATDVGLESDRDIVEFLEGLEWAKLKEHGEAEVVKMRTLIQAHWVVWLLVIFRPYAKRTGTMQVLARCLVANEVFATLMETGSMQDPVAEVTRLLGSPIMPLVNFLVGDARRMRSLSTDWDLESTAQREDVIRICTERLRWMRGGLWRSDLGERFLESMMEPEPEW